LPDQFIVLVGTLLILAGFILAFLAQVIPSIRRGQVRARGGAVILIGPFPIVLGSDRQAAKGLLVLAILLVAILVGFFLLQSFFLPVS